MKSSGRWCNDIGADGPESPLENRASELAIPVKGAKIARTGASGNRDRDFPKASANRRRSGFDSIRFRRAPR